MSKALLIPARAKRRVLLLKSGETALPVRQSCGDYDRWFFEAIGNRLARFETRRPYLNEALPSSAKGYDAVIMTGSPLSVTSPTRWMLRAGQWLLEAAAAGVPVLGVCFGHQLLGHAHGVRVVRNPAGRELGSIDVELTAEGRADPLFDGLPARLTLQATHEDMVPSLPAGATLLARNANSSVQAMAIGRHLRGVQFHPELAPHTMKQIVAARSNALRAEATARGLDPVGWPRQLHEGVRPSPYGPAILRNFLCHFA